MGKVSCFFRWTKRQPHPLVFHFIVHPRYCFSATSHTADRLLWRTYSYPGYYDGLFLYQFCGKYGWLRDQDDIKLFSRQYHHTSQYDHFRPRDLIPRHQDIYLESFSEMKGFLCLSLKRAEIQNLWTLAMFIKHDQNQFYESIFSNIAKEKNSKFISCGCICSIRTRSLCFSWRKIDWNNGQ